MNAWGLALIAVVLNVSAQLGVKLANGVLFSWPLVIALACYFASFYLTLKVYAVNALSLAAPLMAGMAFVLTPMLASVLLGEHLSPGRVLGVASILVGIVLITRSA